MYDFPPSLIESSHSDDSSGKSRKILDDEHHLIARYASRLASETNIKNKNYGSPVLDLDTNRAQRELIAQLEIKNREILKEIQRLRSEQEEHAEVTAQKSTNQRNPTLLAELRLLRQRRDELESRMSSLQESRKELMVQLEGLMKLLKAHNSPKSTPSSSPHSHHTNSPPMMSYVTNTNHNNNSTADALLGTSGDVQQAFGQNLQNGLINSGSALRYDLLNAADSVTNAMSSLVKELHTGSNECDGLTLDELVMYEDENDSRLQQERELLAAYRNSEKATYLNQRNGSHLSNGHGLSHHTEDADHRNIYAERRVENGRLNSQDHHLMKYINDEDLETDQESYIRTDDEEGGNTDWEESMYRWINR